MGELEAFTLILAVATVWLALATSRMAAATRAAVALEVQPHLALETVAWGVSPDPAPPAPPQRYHFSVELKLKNPGKVLVNYRVESMSVLINGQLYHPHGAILNSGGVIHPGVDTRFFYPFVVVPMPVPNPTVAEARYHITYSAINGERWALRARIQSDLPLSGGPIRFLYLEGPIYERV